MSKGWWFLSIVARHDSNKLVFKCFIEDIFYSSDRDFLLYPAGGTVLEPTGPAPL